MLTEPASQTGTDGQLIRLSVTASGTAPLSYQWLRNGLPVDGATDSTLNLPGLRPADDGARYSVRVRNAAGEAWSAEAQLQLALPAQPERVTGCRALQSGGRYLLGSEVGMAAADTACLRLEDVRDVVLDCAGHRIGDTRSGYGGAVVLRRASNVALRNCVIETRWLDLLDVQDISLRGNRIEPAENPLYTVVNVNQARALLFDNNTLRGTYQQYYAEASVIRGNQIRTTSPDVLAGLVVSAYGRHTQVLGNTLDGGWDAFRAGWNGADDGVMLSDETDALVRDNDMRNLFDCGIEWAGVVTRMTAVNNRIDNAAICGVGAWYWASLQDSVVADNRVQRSPRLFLFQRYFGLRPAGWDERQRMPAETWLGWRRNRFERNHLASTPGGSQIESAVLQVFGPDDYANLRVSALPGERLPTAQELVVHDNLFKENDFGLQRPSPVFASTVWPGAVVDGGGNRCQPPKLPAVSPLRCEP